MTTITQVTHNILLLTGLDVAVPAMLLITLFQVYTCTTKLLEIETDLRRMRVRFFLPCIKTCIKYCLALPNSYSLRPSSPVRCCAGREKEGEVATTFLEFEYLHGKSR